MIPWTLIDTGTIPGTDGTLKLMQRGAEFSIMLGGNQLMNSRLSGSEVALATLACARTADREARRILIGGLGMGFTLRAALQVAGPKAQIVVAELVPAVIAWAKGPLSGLFENALSDPRVDLRQADVTDVIRAKKSFYDAILLDVDNGPEGLTRSANDRLYHSAGLAEAYTALCPRGVLAVWSGGADDAFTQRLRRSGFTAEDIAVRATGARKGARHHIWLATRPASRSR
ncbi:spermidine synthase [Bradyrhizobium sp. 2TAF24]|uniref:spermidine synthase n=1 Tax=Bradyrhizobium sp. 2TAF24 TaxID=3233011 RepID=UPI003F912DC0